MAHITGRGLPGNLNRALPSDVDALIDRSSWEVPPLFRFLRNHGSVVDEEMERVFNLGVGHGLVVRPSLADAVARKLEKPGETVFRMGEITSGPGAESLPSFSGGIEPDG